MMTKWFKYTWVCNSDCNALIEYTFQSGYTPNVVEITCLCGSNTTLLSVEDATIQPINEREKMETTTNYDANVLVTYKDIIDGVATYPTIKVNDLEWKLERIKNLEKQLTMSNSQISKIIDNLTIEGWYNPNTEKEEVLRDLCEILGHSPTQTMQWSVTLTVSGSTEVNLDEVEDFDIRYHLDDNLSVDSNDYTTNVDAWHIDCVDSQDWD
jgi:hypothetical protein